MFAEVMLGAAGQYIGQFSGAGSGYEDIGNLILAAKLHCRTENFAGLDFQMAENLGLFAAQQDVDVLFELQQGNVNPPAFVVRICDHAGPVRVAFIEQRTAESVVDAFDGFVFGHEIVLATIINLYKLLIILLFLRLTNSIILTLPIRMPMQRECIASSAGPLHLALAPDEQIDGADSTINMKMRIIFRQVFSMRHPCLKSNRTALERSDKDNVSAPPHQLFSVINYLPIADVNWQFSGPN